MVILTTNSQYISWKKVHIHNVLETGEIGSILSKIHWNPVHPFKTKQFNWKHPKYISLKNIFQTPYMPIIPDYLREIKKH